MLELEVLNPPADAAGLDLIRALADQLQAKVLDGRQHVGDGYRPIAAVELELDLVLGLAGLPVQAHQQPGVALCQRLELRDVTHGVLRRGVLVIARRERGAPAAETRGGQVTVERLVERLAEPVWPGPDRIFDAALQQRRVDAPHGVGVGAHQQVYARQCRLGQLHLGLDRQATEHVDGDPLDALAHLGVVAVARHVEE